MPVTTEPTYLRPAIATALVSTILGLLVTCIFVAFGWLHDRTGSFTGVVTGGVRGWLVSHGSGITANGVEVSTIPLGATLIALGVVIAVTVRVLREPLEDAAPFVAVVAGTYGVFAGLLSLATNTEVYSTVVVRSAIGSFVVATLGAVLGVAVKNRSFRAVWPTDNLRFRIVVTAAWQGVVALLVPSLLIVVLLFAVHVDRASDLWASLGPGFLGSFGLAGVCLVLIPNLVLWTASVLLGPGFALGTDTSVDLTGSHLGAVPGLPILAGLPAPGEFAGWVFLLGLLPLLAGAYAGWRIKKAAGRSVLEHVGLGAAAGAVAGLVIGILISLSGGSVGPGRMADAGPPAVTPALVAIGVLALGGAIGAALGHYRVGRALNITIARPRLRSRHQSPSAD